MSFCTLCCFVGGGAGVKECNGGGKWLRLLRSHDSASAFLFVVFFGNAFVLLFLYGSRGVVVVIEFLDKQQNSKEIHLFFAERTKLNSGCC